MVVEFPRVFGFLTVTSIYVLALELRSGWRLHSRKTRKKCTMNSRNEAIPSATPKERLNGKKGNPHSWYKIQDLG